MKNIEYKELISMVFEKNLATKQNKDKLFKMAKFIILNKTQENKYGIFR